MISSSMWRSRVFRSLVLLDSSKAFDSMVHGLQVGLVASLVGVRIKL
jgi:hypothetical protein